MISIGKFVSARFYPNNSAKLRAEIGNLADFFLQILFQVTTSVGPITSSGERMK